MPCILAMLLPIEDGIQSSDCVVTVFEGGIYLEKYSTYIAKQDISLSVFLQMLASKQGMWHSELGSIFVMCVCMYVCTHLPVMLRAISLSQHIILSIVHKQSVDHISLNNKGRPR